jgi:hypothetical protein
MKSKLLLLVVLALALPMAAFADSETFTSTGGLLTGDSGGLVLTNAVLTSFGTNGTVVTGTLGTVSFQTGVLTGNTNINGGGPFNAGGTITVTGNGTNGVANGVLFTGSFSQGTWTATVNPDGTNQYTLSAIVTGTSGTSDASGQYVLTVDGGHLAFSTINNAGGTTGATSTGNLSVPEPGELSLMGTGLLGLIGAIRRKMKVQG